jgi:hypothetical protein
MLNQHTHEDIQALQSIGVEPSQSFGWEVMDLNEYILREYYNIRLENGYDAPEERLPIPASRKERELKYREKLMFDLEGERCNREQSGFPDQWDRFYDDDELASDEDHGDIVPEFVYNKRRVIDRSENRKLRSQKHRGRVSRNKEISIKLRKMIDARLEDNKQ